MKKSRYLFGLVVPLISACSCSILSTAPFKWDDYKNDSVAMSLESKRFQNFKYVDISSLEGKKEALKNIVTQQESFAKFRTAYNELDSIYINIVDSYIIASTKYYAESTDANQDKANSYHDAYVNLNKFLIELETDIYHSSNEIKKSYFSGMSDAQIEARLEKNAIDALEADYDKVLSDYKDEGNQLYLKYTTDKNKTSFLNTGYDYFLRYINKAKELVDKLPYYKNYLEYSYDNDYSRDYKYTDTDAFVTYVKQYFVPIAKAKGEIEQPDSVDSDLYNIINSYNFCNRGSDMAELFSSYAETMGGKYLTCYNNAFKYGYYCFSNSPDSMGTAYEWNLYGINDAVLFFSRRYQDILSVAHEFGHYYSCQQGSGVRRGDAYDLQETYSQGNEFTFCQYLLEQKAEDSKKDTFNYYVDDKIYDSVTSLINEAAITEIEKFAYTTPDLTKEALIDGVNAILETYEGTAGDVYFMAACLTSPCYYISYATSLIEALQFAAMPSFADAKEKYTKLVETNGSFTMVQRWENAGLTSPFDEETFKTLAKLFSDISKKY